MVLYFYVLLFLNFHCENSQIIGILKELAFVLTYK